MADDKKVRYFNKESDFELINNLVLTDGELTFKFPVGDESCTFTTMSRYEWLSTFETILFDAECKDIKLDTFTFHSGTIADVFKTLYPLFSNGPKTPIEKRIAKAKVLGVEVIDLIPKIRKNELNEYVFLIKLGNEYELISPLGFGCITKSLLYRIACIAKKIVIKGDIPVYFDRNPFALASIEIDSPYFISEFEYDSKDTLGLRRRYHEESFFEPYHNGFGNFYTHTWNILLKPDYDFKENPVLLTKEELSPLTTKTIKGKDVLIQPQLFNKRANHFENLEEIDVENLILILDKRIKIPKGCTAKKFKSICMKECFKYSNKLDKKKIQLKVLKSFPYVDLNLFYKHYDKDDWCIPIEDLTEEQIENARLLIRRCRIQGTPYHGRITGIKIAVKNPSTGRKSKHYLEIYLEITGSGQAWLLPDGREVYDMEGDWPLSHIRFKNFKKPKRL